MHMKNEKLKKVIHTKNGETKRDFFNFVYKYNK